jgi:uncharacterized protein YggU (UPF0235/DUF167 family)
MEDWSDLAVPGTVIAVRVTPGARVARIERAGAGLRVWVTVPPEGGRATAAVAEAVAKALGIAKSRIVLVRGAASRDKLFRVEGS